MDLIKFRLKKRARMTASMLASAAFIGLAVWGWNLPLSTVIAFFVICMVCLGIIVLLAAGVGWLLSRRRRSVADKDLPF